MNSPASTEPLNQDLDIGPWWREPWPWLLMLGPFVAIIGCAITIVLAVQNYSDQAIQDGGQRQGLVVTKPAATDPPPAP